MPQRGLTIIYTGDGKGKTTASFGQALRAAGHGFQVCVVQFIKGKWATGEAQAVAALSDHIELHVMGSGFTWQSEEEEVRKAAAEGWALAREKVMSGRYDCVVLDELTYLVTYGLVSEAEVVALIKERPAHVHLVISGRGATQKLIDAAELVTEMKEVKHPFSLGIKAQKGIEF